MPVNSKHEDYRKYEPEWQRCRDCIEGEQAIKARKTLYLPALSGEDGGERYAGYLKRALFFNACGRTARALSGFLFRKSLQFTPDDSVLLNDFIVSPGGFQAFTRELAAEVIKVGRVGILIDTPLEGGDPRMLQYRAEDIINWGSKDSQIAFLVLREFVEREKRDDPFKVEKIEQYRVLDFENGAYRQRLFQKLKNSDSWFEFSRVFPVRNGTRLDFIPFVIINSIDLSLTPSKPPLLDIVNVNLSHYRSSADLEAGRHFVAFPTPWAAGFDVDDGETLEIGGVAWVTDKTDARAGFLEFTGQGLGALENALEEKEKMMAVLGARLLEAQKKMTEAADTHRLRYAGEQAVLAEIAWNLDAGITKAMQICAWWRGLRDADKFSIVLNKDYAGTQADPALVTALFAALQGSGISYETWFDNLKRWEMIPQSRTLDDELALIEARMPII